MVTVCPTVTASDSAEFRRQMDRISSFAERVHIDVADGIFTPNKLIGLSEVWWPAGLGADLHVMYQDPLSRLEQLLQLKPNLIIFHSEAVGNFFELARPLKRAGIEVGLALLPDTTAESIMQALPELDHVLIFSGDLGHFGGTANPNLLEKIAELKKHKVSLEFGWDGGINADNAAALVAGGVDVLNVGGFIQRADKPSDAYAKLKSISGVKYWTTS